jgi:hypothetical protein
MKRLLPIAVLLAVNAIGCSGAAGKSGASSSSSPSAAQGAAADEDPGEYGPGLNQVHVVRSLTVKITGGLTETISGKKEDGHTTLGGGCKPDMFANLGFDTGGLFDDHGGIAFVTNDPIKLGQTGEIDLDWVMITMFKTNKGKGEPESKRFMSDGGTLTLTTHDPSRGRRRIVGTIVAKDLQPKDNLQSKPVDVEAAFDADFSCGVK